MKKLALIGLVAGFSVGLAAATAAAEDAANSRTITATGTGEVKATPDTAEVNLEVTTQAVTAASALRDNRTAIDSLLRRLAEHGVSAREARLSAPRLTPEFDESFSDVGQPEVSGYRVSTQVHVKVRRLDRLGRVIDDAAAERARLVGDIAYSLGDAPSLRAEAQRKALADARRKAEEYARAAGMEVGEVLQIKDEQPAGSGSGDSYGKASAPDEQVFRASVAVTYTAGKPSRKIETAPPPSDRDR
jgi:uncharacterized protein YggE